MRTASAVGTEVTMMRREQNTQEKREEEETTLFFPLTKTQNRQTARFRFLDGSRGDDFFPRQEPIIFTISRAFQARTQQHHNGRRSRRNGSAGGGGS